MGSINTNISPAMLKHQIYESKIVPPVLRRVLNQVLKGVSDLTTKTNFNKSKKVIHTDLVTTMAWAVMKETTMPAICKAFNITLDEYYEILDEKKQEKRIEDLHWKIYYEIHGDFQCILEYLEFKIDSGVTNSDGSTIYL